MTDKLPPNLLALFQPRPPLRYIPPQDTAPDERATRPSQLSGLAAFLPQRDEYRQTDEYEPTESWLQKRERKRLEKKERLEEMQKPEFDGYKPSEDPKIKGDAVKTLFVGRLSYDVKESDLEREFGRFGPIERIRIVKDESNPKPKKPHRGYAFIVYEREKDMRGNFLRAFPTFPLSSSPSATQMLPTKKPKDCESRIVELWSMSNVAGWSLAGDHEGLVEVLVDVDIPNKHLQDQHLERRRPDLETVSEEASVVVAGFVEASAATEEALATEVAFEVVAALATKIVEALADETEAATRAVHHHLMHPVDQAAEVGMGEASRTDEMATEATEVEQEATKIPSVVEIVGMIETVAIEIETEIVIETATDTAEADATTTTAREKGTMRTMGTMTRDRDGDTDFESVLRIGRCLLRLWTTVGWWVSFYHPCIQIIVSGPVMVFYTTW
ncbi:hypothetical protein LTR10_020487 [Elasticomyces elasticus]|uniref:RRM domain-containing protein n=1 Tax=Exophiala sideris TaxID=1016849 RepID=A0ABR0J1U8_9EURO|nr:hypothetical protein LTR10_020487 [Elasticomyces elasticus]KAK5024713.1 hypothetical protein LTS07_008559 [Exophiala sideris]KAK5030806.1 hypothetical protein LTR13_008160 [Exophiala sideris]KAK5054348.1 hypothetical protein LTR69_008963 [Exophiala sideris]KAK5179748.1 hypothetical protein LTR44_007916 [Eurotiomycetes sp. CCFEE 6388]